MYVEILHLPANGWLCLYFRLLYSLRGNSFSVSDGIVKKVVDRYFVQVRLETWTEWKIETDVKIAKK